MEREAGRCKAFLQKVESRLGVIGCEQTQKMRFSSSDRVARYSVKSPDSGKSGGTTEVKTFVLL